MISLLDFSDLVILVTSVDLITFFGNNFSVLASFTVRTNLGGSQMFVKLGKFYSN